jgi:transcriptional regulator with XRE-family HTH domain
MDLRQVFADLRRLRHAKGLSQEELAYEAGVNHYETRKTGVTQHEQHALQKAQCSEMIDVTLEPSPTLDACGNIWLATDPCDQALSARVIFRELCRRDESSQKSNAARS